VDEQSAPDPSARRRFPPLAFGAGIVADGNVEAADAVDERHLQRDATFGPSIL
jgi:hypothetical protein